VAFTYMYTELRGVGPTSSIAGSFLCRQRGLNHDILGALDRKGMIETHQTRCPLTLTDRGQAEAKRALFSQMKLRAEIIGYLSRCNKYNEFQ
jgi:hypothetical protein